MRERSVFVLVSLAHSQVAVYALRLQAAAEKSDSSLALKAGKNASRKRVDAP